ncbi:MAG: hypothetical protein DBX52_00795 [Clostridiales bacterium]|nr:MAG: hypothetical protein DBX52_00795 [Clostridiales bacterium]
MLKRILQGFRWIGKHWAISLVCFLIVAISVATAVFWNVFGKEKAEIVPIYVTVSGLEEGKNMQSRELMVKNNDTIAQIFSLEYPEIYEMFLQPLVMNNVFRSFMGVSQTSSKQFYVKIDGTYENILTQAYIRPGAIVEIEYR